MMKAYPLGETKHHKDPQAIQTYSKCYRSALPVLLVDAQYFSVIYYETTIVGEKEIWWVVDDSFSFHEQIAQINLGSKISSTKIKHRGKLSQITYGGFTFHYPEISLTNPKSDYHSVSYLSLNKYFTILGINHTSYSI